MNQQLIELMKQSGFDCAPDGNVYHPDTGDQSPLNVYLEKFAELTSRQCEEKYKKKTEAYRLHIEWQADAIRGYQDQIQEHFRINDGGNNDR